MEIDINRRPDNPHLSPSTAAEQSAEKVHSRRTARWSNVGVPFNHAERLASKSFPRDRARRRVIEDDCSPHGTRGSAFERDPVKF